MTGNASLTREFVAAALGAHVPAEVVAAALSPLEDLLVSSLMAAGETPVGRLLTWCVAEDGSGGWLLGHPGAVLSPSRAALAGASRRTCSTWTTSATRCAGIRRR